MSLWQNIYIGRERDYIYLSLSIHQYSYDVSCPRSLHPTPSLIATIPPPAISVLSFSFFLLCTAVVYTLRYCERNPGLNGERERELQRPLSLSLSIYLYVDWSRKKVEWYTSFCHFFFVGGTLFFFLSLSLFPFCFSDGKNDLHRGGVGGRDGAPATVCLGVLFEAPGHAGGRRAWRRTRRGETGEAASTGSAVRCCLHPSFFFSFFLFWWAMLGGALPSDVKRERRLQGGKKK